MLHLCLRCCKYVVKKCNIKCNISQSHFCKHNMLHYVTFMLTYMLHVCYIANLPGCTEADRLDMARVPYNSAVGSLMYAAIATRPDIAASVSALCRFMKNPGRVHWTAVQRVLAYLRGTASMPLAFNGSKGIVPHGYCDADWAGDRDTRRSTTGYVFSMSGDLLPGRASCSPLLHCPPRRRSTSLSTSA